MGETITCRILVVIHLESGILEDLEEKGDDIIMDLGEKDREAENEIEMTVFSGGI
jgi:hypothetical protein